MEEILLQDDRKKEGKRGVFLLVFITLIAIAETIVSLFSPIEDAETDWIVWLCIFTPLICIGIIPVTGVFMYKITVTANQIFRKTLFGTKSICFSEIQSYTSKFCNKFNQLYEFKFFANGKAFTIYIHYPNKMIEIYNSSREPIESDKPDGEASE